MHYLELSTENSKKHAIELAEKINGTYDPEVVVFVSKGAYQIGLDIGEYFSVPVMEIFAKREKGKIKQLMSPMLKIIPSKLKKLLRELEVTKSIHKKNPKRNVHWGYIPEECVGKNFSRILLVDDSCDTGNTFRQCVDEIRRKYPHSEVKTAAINVFKDSFLIFKTDFYIYMEYLLSGPWSNDSNEHKDFTKNYIRIFKNGNFRHN